MKDQDNLRRLRREWYHRNRDAQLALTKERKAIRDEKITKYLRELKESTPCTDCGGYYPHYVMDFDHLRDKMYNLSNHNGSRSIASVQREIAKCEIVCSNCHRERTWQRNHRVIV